MLWWLVLCVMGVPVAGDGVPVGDGIRVADEWVPVVCDRVPVVGEWVPVA